MTTFSEFRANIKDIARPNRFLITIIGDILSKQGVNRLPSNYKFATQKAGIPKLDITGPKISYRGTSMVLSGDYKKDPLPITFWNDIEWLNRNFFESWMAYIVSSSTLNERRNTNDFRLGTSIFVDQIGQGGRDDIIASYQYFDVAPLDISEISLDQTIENTLEEFSVTFQYSRWVNLRNNPPAFGEDSP